MVLWTGFTLKTSGAPAGDQKGVDSGYFWKNRRLTQTAHTLIGYLVRAYEQSVLVFGKY